MLFMREQEFGITLKPWQSAVVDAFNQPDGSAIIVVEASATKGKDWLANHLWLNYPNTVLASHGVQGLPVTSKKQVIEKIASTAKQIPIHNVVFYLDAMPQDVQQYALEIAQSLTTSGKPFFQTRIPGKVVIIARQTDFQCGTRICVKDGVVI
jgi:hypothetical protein